MQQKPVFLLGFLFISAFITMMMFATAVTASATGAAAGVATGIALMATMFFMLVIAGLLALLFQGGPDENQTYTRTRLQYPDIYDRMANHLKRGAMYGVGDWNHWGYSVQREGDTYAIRTRDYTATGYYPFQDPYAALSFCDSHAPLEQWYEVTLDYYGRPVSKQEPFPLQQPIINHYNATVIVMDGKRPKTPATAIRRSQRET